ncbi:hypothetical protein ACSVIJ_04410 [Pseudomonas sp. NCHU5208]|uniref:hypothetical protein n=1 Tax=unclassified Pseudomonas TaxID=196821 RepID=UPI003F9DBAC1
MVTILAIIAAAVILYLVLQLRAPHDIHRKFGLQPGHWELVGSDLGKGHPRKRLNAFGLAGEPDALFRGKRTGQIVVGEFKNRRHAGYVRHREYYQVIICIGLARETFGESNVVGVLVFKDKRLEIPHDEALFRSLIGMRGECLGSMKQRKPLNDRPLHRRIAVRPGSRKISFPK